MRELLNNKWCLGMTLTVGYVVFVYSRFRGKEDPIAEEGYN